MELRKITGKTVILIIKDKDGLDRTTSHDSSACLRASTQENARGV